MKVCLTGTIRSQENSGGSAWSYLTWALGLHALNCDVVWLEAVDPDLSDEELQRYISIVRKQLSEHGVEASIALCSWNGDPLRWDGTGWYISIADVAAQADVILNVGYFPHPAIANFRRSIFVDSDPGLTQLWLSAGQLRLPKHSTYFTISETVGTPDAVVPDCGIRWHFTPLPVSLPSWPLTPSQPLRPFTTVSNWWGDFIDYGGQCLSNAKRTAFLEFLNLPKLTDAALELGLTLTGAPADKAERSLLETNGWRVRSLWDTAWTPKHYRDYVQQSTGEFSCVKPFYVRLRSALIHDRTLHYLASGKPAVVQDTGPTRFMPSDGGLFRFRTLEGASHALNTVMRDYERHCRLARALAEEYFDAVKVITRMLEHSLS